MQGLGAVMKVHGLSIPNPRRRAKEEEEGEGGQPTLTGTRVMVSLPKMSITFTATV